MRPRHDDLPPGARRILLVLCAQVFVLHVGQSMIIPILPLYAAQFGAGPALIGVLLAAQSVPRLFANVPAGRLADSLGAHRLLVFSSAAAVVGALGSALAPAFIVLLLARVIHGVSGAVTHTAGLVYAASLGGPESRGRRISLYQGSFLLGNGAGPVLGGLVAQHYGYQVPFLLFAGLAVATTVWVLVSLPDPRRITSSPRAPRPTDQTDRMSTRQLLLQSGFTLACLMAMLAAYTRTGSRDYALVTLSSSRGLVEGQIGAALTLVFAANVAILYVAGVMIDRYGPKSAMVPSWLLIAAGLATLVLADGYTGLLIAAVLYGTGSGLGNAAPTVHIANTVPPEQQGHALGVFRTFTDIGMVIGPVVMGLLATTVGLVWGVWLNVAVVLAAAVIYLAIGPAGPRRGPDRAGPWT